MLVMMRQADMADIGYDSGSTVHDNIAIDSRCCTYVCHMVKGEDCKCVLEVYER